MLHKKLVVGISFLTCLVIVAGCQRETTPEVSATGAGSSQVSEATTQPTGSLTKTQTNAPSSQGSQGSQGKKSSPSSPSSQRPGNGNGSDQKAAGSPIDVPSVPDQHTSMEGLRPVIEAVFVGACGGEKLCVKLTFGAGACLLGYEPANKAVRGSTVKVLTETQGACDSANGVTTPSSDGPIDVPSVPDQHTSMDGLRPAIEAVFVNACGGQELCVKLTFGAGACLLGYEPANTAVRGSTVRVLTETQHACDSANGVSTPSSDGPSDGPSHGSGGAGSSTGATDGSGSG